MSDYIFLHHNDAGDHDIEEWAPYLDRLRELGVLHGGSPIGDGVTYRKSGAPRPVTSDIYGYIRVQADDLAAASRLLEGHPCYEAGGTVEIRQLPWI
jgi:hypothetical protein